MENMLNHTRKVDRNHAVPLSPHILQNEKTVKLYHMVTLRHQGYFINYSNARYDFFSSQFIT